MVVYAPPKEIERFKKWLVSQGVEILLPTNEWEVLRFKCGSSIGLAHCSAKSNGHISAANSRVKAAWKAWKDGNPLPLAGKPKAKKRTKRDQVSAALADRDGDTCWYCGHGWDIEHRQTVEHLVPIAHGGPNHMSNLVLACGGCNARAGHLSVAEKVRLRDIIRTEFAETIFWDSYAKRQGTTKYLTFSECHDGGVW